ncbi:MAG: DUF3343 domain-containing protein [Clostridia bacterium]
MSGCLIVLRSVTYAQRAKRVLERSGVSAVIVRPDASMIGGSCGYAVKVAESFLADALAILRQNGFEVKKVLLVSRDGTMREV